MNRILTFGGLKKQLHWLKMARLGQEILMEMVICVEINSPQEKDFLFSFTLMSASARNHMSFRSWQSCLYITLITLWFCTTYAIPSIPPKRDTEDTLKKRAGNCKFRRIYSRNSQWKTFFVHWRQWQPSRDNWMIKEALIFRDFDTLLWRRLILMFWSLNLRNSLLPKAFYYNFVIVLIWWHQKMIFFLY